MMSTITEGQGKVNAQLSGKRALTLVGLLQEVLIAPAVFVGDSAEER